MNTCKATLRVLFAHRVYLMIYLVFIGILMMSISWAMLTSAWLHVRGVRIDQDARRHHRPRLRPG